MAASSCPAEHEGTWHNIAKNPLASSILWLTMDLAWSHKALSPSFAITKAECRRRGTKSPQLLLWAEGRYPFNLIMETKTMHLCLQLESVICPYRWKINLHRNYFIVFLAENCSIMAQIVCKGIIRHYGVMHQETGSRLLQSHYFSILIVCMLLMKYRFLHQSVGACKRGSCRASSCRTHRDDKAKLFFFSTIAHFVRAN